LGNESTPDPRFFRDDAERDHIAETEVLATVVGGKVVYEKR
jgi:hypothetical protein